MVIFQLRSKYCTQIKNKRNSNVMKDCTILKLVQNLSRFQFNQFQNIRFRFRDTHYQVPDGLVSQANWILHLQLLSGQNFLDRLHFYPTVNSLVTTTTIVFDAEKGAVLRRKLKTHLYPKYYVFNVQIYTTCFTTPVPF